ncbi:hypothetical protein AOQ72_20740 [Bradyrhizobium yuanmingense]|uniref:Uncharacterized protein n=1 Tax=Bradyrhizobium yuanmingense TaxID=108015 RepID=A0A0R3CEV3_9BRAD|nr:hypothetical protein AOQ72_20740 [Bradyrhizobium yuanmingense]
MAGAFSVSLWRPLRTGPFGVVRTCPLLAKPRSEQMKEERITEGSSWIDPRRAVDTDSANLAEMLRL